MALFGVVAAMPAQTREQPVGLVLLPGDAGLLRAGDDLPLKLRAGDLLFTGDGILSHRTAAQFLFCPDRVTVEVSPAAEIRFDPRAMRVRAGKLVARRPVASCILPQTIRVSIASQQQYSITMIRALVPAKPASAGLDSHIQDLPMPDRLRVRRELEPIQSALAASPGDPTLQLALAAVLERNQLAADATIWYRTVAAQWPDATWLRGKIFDVEEAAARAEVAAAARPLGGRTYALVVGVSTYQKLPTDRWLRYAHADAALFARHLKSPRGGGLAEAEVSLLVNEAATTAAIRNAFETFLKGRAGPKDTVVLFIAAHGMAVANRGAYILTWDNDPEDPAATALSMADVHHLLREGLPNVGRVLAFVDVCRAGAIAEGKNPKLAAAVERLSQVEGQLFGLMANRPTEPSFEGPDFGGGHGVFSYYLIKGLAGAADENDDGIVDVDELITYVGAEVARSTAKKQHPYYFAVIDNATPLSDKRKPGIEITRFPLLKDPAGAPVRLAAATPSPFPQTQSPGRVDLGELADLKRRLSPEEYLAAENRVRVALEERGQQELLRYLRGDQVAQTQADFEAGAAAFRSARQLTPESIFLLARELFCMGRTRIFQKDYPGAIDLLEQAARLDSAGAYSFNALGIAYLEQAEYTRAAAAFRDAIRRAPDWVYPRHNLALTQMETGNYEDAIATYKTALQLAPGYAYLSYNLGLLYQRLDRRKDSERQYLRAFALDPGNPNLLNALGYLRASEGKAAEAERLYRQALEKDPRLLVGRHNLAVLLAGLPGRSEEGLALWRENLAEAPVYLPSRLSLAGALARLGRHREAASEYERVVDVRPEYLGARIALARTYLSLGRTADAMGQLQKAAQSAPDSPEVLEALGDAYVASGRAGEAATAYERALQNATGSETRKRLRARVKALSRGVSLQE